MCIADRREFLRISQAVGMGFLIMGVIGYVVKLSKNSLRVFRVIEHLKLTWMVQYIFPSTTFWLEEHETHVSKSGME